MTDQGRERIRSSRIYHFAFCIFSVFSVLSVVKVFLERYR